MGYLMKFNMYLDKSKLNHKSINMEDVKNNFSAYDKWLEKNNKSDLVESYKKFLISN